MRTASWCRILVSVAAILVGATWAASVEGEECGESILNSDGSHEWGVTWQGDEVVPPDYGAFAECYQGDVEICACVYYLTQLGSGGEQTMDLYVWADDGGRPGEVLHVERDRHPGAIGFWPSFTRNVVALAQPVCVSGRWWVGYWPRWPGSTPDWFLGQDLDGPGGCPMTNIAPGLGYPSGWQNVSVAFGPTQAIGIGALVNPCPPTPARDTSWGAVKSIYKAQ